MKGVRWDEIRNSYKILVGKPEDKRPFRRPRRGGENNNNNNNNNNK
jgi:hypothetical protein